MKILCVDDEETVVNIVSLYLRDLGPGTEVLRAFDDATALEMLEREEPDLVILDLFLVDISGYEVIRRIRRQSAVPMIILTGLAGGNVRSCGNWWRQEERRRTLPAEQTNTPRGETGGIRLGHIILEERLQRGEERGP